MPSRLRISAAIILCLSLLLSVILNFESAPALQNQRQLSFEQIEKSAQNDWQNILAALPQYKKAERALTEKELAAQTALLNSAAKQPVISDAQLIGIIVDTPPSVLLFLQQANIEPIQLSLGEGWLPDWQLSQINADSAIWHNIKTQQKYTQFLFSNAGLNIDTTNTTSNEIK
jgi:hypothetical protein